tara:strand:- start:1104 stop:2069 length:966 start_codon:yes stop_codon:yes gene_type:complete
MGQVNANIFSSNVSIKIANYANENSYPSLGAGDAGTLVYDESLKALIYWNGQGWNKISFQGPESGDSPQTAIRDFQAWSQSNPVSGSYWVKPTGYGGSAEQVYVAVNESSQSGITSGGVWVRIRYAESYYSRSNAWRGQGGLSNPANQSSTAYSGDFSFEQSNAWISGLLTTGNFTEIRQTFESWGYGSVGWTYGSGYMESRGFDDVNYTRWGTNSNIVGKDYSRVNGMSHRSGGSLNGPFDNPTGRNTDDTDRNDSTWRYGRFHFRYVPPGGSSALPLPIKGIWNADVDGGSEQRYFPFRDAAGGWTGSGDSNIWVKVAN